MALITPSFLQSIQTNLNTVFQSALTQAPSFYEKIAMVTTSTGQSTHYPLVDRFPSGLREWLGERVKQGQTIYDEIIKNKKFELTTSLRREDVEDNQFDIANYTTQAIALKTAQFPDQQITVLLESNVATGYDQLPLFSAVHPVGDGSTNVQSNFFSTASGGTSRPLNAANFTYALAAWKGLKGADGYPLNVGSRPILMVPTGLEWTAHTLLHTSIIAPSAATGGNANSVQQQNVLANVADLVVNPWLGTTPGSTATAWYLIDGASPLKPFIYQQRTAPEFVWMNQSNNDNVFLHDEYTYGVRLRAGFGVSLWYLTLKMDV